MLPNTTDESYPTTDTSEDGIYRMIVKFDKIVLFGTTVGVQVKFLEQFGT